LEEGDGSGNMKTQAESEYFGLNCGLRLSPDADLALESNDRAFLT
jgi:hypothetical protein